MNARIKSKSSEMKLPPSPARNFSLEFFHFHLSFVCLLYLLSRIVSLVRSCAAIAPLLLLASNFSLFPSSPTRLCSPPSPTTQLAPIPVPNGIHVSFHPATSTQIYFNPQQLDTRKSFRLCCCCWCGLERLEVFKFYFNVCTEH